MIGGRVRQLREERGWTQSELAARAGLTASAVSQIESAKRSPNAETLQKLADGLEVSVDALMGRKSDEMLLAGDQDARVLLRGLQDLSPDDRRAVRAMVDALRRKKRGADE